MSIEIWGKPACPSCNAAKALCETRGYDYSYKELGKDFDREQMLEKFPTARTFPQIIVDGQKIGGYTDFEKLLSARKKHA